MIDLLYMEKLYLNMFALSQENIIGTDFFDPKQKDKYMHNLLMVYKDDVCDQILIDYEKTHQTNGFVIYRFERKSEEKYSLLNDYDIQTYGYYQSAINQLNIPLKNRYHIERVDPVNASDFFDFMYTEDLLFGSIYAKGNIKRQKEVLIKENHRFFYLMVKDGQTIIGHINAFIDGTHAKIDEFYVKEAYQKNGYGTSLMAHMIELLTKKGITDVYLVTDLEDTAKILYEKYGFQLVNTYKHYQKIFK